MTPGPSLLPGAGHLDWNGQYHAGRWTYLADGSETPRYEAVAAKIRQRGEPSVLDLGCGEGLLQGALAGRGYGGLYVGVDWAFASMRAAARSRPAGFICGDVLALPLHGTFQAVVLSEVLYYLPDPEGALTAIARQHLSPDGLLLISLYKPPTGRSPTWSKIVNKTEAVVTRLFPAATRQIIAGPNEGRTWTIFAAEGHGARV